MVQLSLTQEYLLCSLNEKGKYSSMDMQKGVCLVAGGILELLMEDILRLEHQTLTVLAPLPSEKGYLQEIYSLVAGKGPVKVERVVEYFSFSISDKHLSSLMQSVGNSLVAAGCAEKAAGGFFRKSVRYRPVPQAKDSVVQSIRAELLEDGELSEDIVALTVLLHKSDCLSCYFFAYEKKDLKARLKSIRDSGENRLVGRMVEYIDNLFAMVVLAATR